MAPVLEAAGPHVARLMASTEQRLAEVAAGHGEALGTHARATLEAGGKRLRPVLVFVCGGQSESEHLVRAAAAVELLHMATLVHDDVLDRAPQRRGRPTVFATGGRTAATAVGDFLFSRAFAELAATGEPEAVRALSHAATSLARGELLQREDAFSADVTEERYLERCRLKTARLFEAACRLGAVLGDSPATADGLGRFGDRIGLAFQLFDDVLDIAGPPEMTGKGRGTDLLDGTATLPVVLAGKAGSRPAGPAEAERLCEEIAASGALEETRARALGLVEDAKASLPGLLPAQRRALELVADGVVERYA